MDSSSLTTINTIVTCISILVSIGCALIASYQAYKARKQAKIAKELREDLLEKVSYVNLKGYHSMFPIAHRSIMAITEEEKLAKGNDLRDKLAAVSELVSTFQSYAMDFTSSRRRSSAQNYCTQIYQFMANDIDIRPLNTVGLIRCITNLEEIVAEEMNDQSNSLKKN